MYQAFLVVAMSIAGARTGLQPAQIESRFEAACVDGRWEADCPMLRLELEVQLLGDLRALALQGAPIDREWLRTAAQGTFPPLVEFALRSLNRIESPADRAAVVAAIDSPSPGVRQMANEILRAANDGWSGKQGRWWQERRTPGMAPDVVPDVEALGLAPLPDLRYRFFASSEHRAVFTTKLPPNQLLDRIAKGKKVLTGAEVGSTQLQATAASMADLQKELQAALARGDLNALQAIAERASKLGTAAAGQQEAAAIRPVAEFAGDPSRVRYVQLSAARAEAPPITAAVGPDDDLGETVLVITY